MTDPKELAELANKIRAASEFIEPDLPEYGTIADALESYARILAASEDVREIEEKRDAAQAIWNAGRWGSGPSTGDVLRWCAHLLDVVRKQGWELETARRDLNRRILQETALVGECLSHAEPCIGDPLKFESGASPGNRLLLAVCKLTDDLADARTALDEERARHAETRDAFWFAACEETNARKAAHEMRQRVATDYRLAISELSDKLAAAEKRAETMAEGVRLAYNVLRAYGLTSASTQAWWDEHGAEVGELYKNSGDIQPESCAMHRPGGEGK